MTKHALIFASVVSLGSYGSFAEEIPPLRSELQAELAQVVAEQMEAWSIPGAAVAIVEAGEILLLEGYGVANVESGTPVDPRETVFHVASLSKPVTASAALQLVGRGLLALDQPIDLSRYSGVDRSPFHGEVTLRHLLTHTAGFDRGMVGRKTRDPEELGALRDHLERNLPPVVRPPGEVSVYSNYGYALAGVLIEDASGVPFGRYVDEHLFRPLGMRHSSFLVEPAIERAMATGYGWRGAREPPVPRDYIRTVPASMLRTSAADMSRWMLAILEGGGWDGVRVLDPGSARSLLARQFSNHPLLPGRSFGLSEGARFDPPEFLHAGGTSGFSSAVVLHPELRLGVFVAFNSQAPPWEIIRRILDRYAEGFEPPAMPQPAVAPFDTEAFAGSYRNAEIPATSVARLGALVGQARVRSAGPGLIEWEGKTWEAIAPLAFRERGGSRIVAFGESRGSIRYFFRSGGEYERVPWMSSFPVQAAIWVSFIGTFLAAALLWTMLQFRARRLPGAPPRWPLAVAFVASAANLAFIIAVAATLARELEGGGVLEYGLPAWLVVLLAVPLLTGLLAIVASVGSALAWRAGWWSRSLRIWNTTVAIALLAFPPFLASWNLLSLWRV